MKARLKRRALHTAGISTLGTPRRLVVSVEGLLPSQSDASLEVRGPKKEAAFDPDGEPTKALLGFARGQGVELADIEVRDDGKAAHVYAKKQVRARTLALLPEILTGLAGADLFKKSMRWGSGALAFARPIHWITALFGDSIIDFDYCDVKSGNHTLWPQIPLWQKGIKPGQEDRGKGLSDYRSALKKAFVIVDRAERKAIIEKGLKEAALEVGGVVVKDPALVDGGGKSRRVPGRRKGYVR